MRAIFKTITSVLLLTVVLATSIAQAAAYSGKVFMVVENQLAVVDPANEMQRFDISMAAIYRNGLLAPSAALSNGDWVTVTAEDRDGRLVATLVEASSDRRSSDP
jgi:hypothetical protein